MSERTRPTVSVIIPCYNQRRYLPDAVGSLEAQTFADWECIIIDDGSTDDTAEVARSLTNEDPRLRYIHQPNSGVSRARNHGLDEARGRYIQFLDADDMLAPEKLALQLEALSSAGGLALAYCDYTYCAEDGKPIRDHICYRSPVLDAEDPLRDIALGWETKLCIPIQCFLLDARFFAEHGLRFDESLPNNEDWDCWMRIFAMRPDARYIDRKLAIYRYVESSRSNDRVLMRSGFLRAIRKQRDLLRDDPEMRAVLTKKLRTTAYLYRDFAPVRRIVMGLLVRPRLFLRRRLPGGTRQYLRGLIHRQ